jgi:hypothetical protein
MLCAFRLTGSTKSGFATGFWLEILRGILRFELNSHAVCAADVL